MLLGDSRKDFPEKVILGERQACTPRLSGGRELSKGPALQM